MKLPRAMLSAALLVAASAKHVEAEVVRRVVAPEGDVSLPVQPLPERQSRPEIVRRAVSPEGEAIHPVEGTVQKPLEQQSPQSVPVVVRRAAIRTVDPFVPNNRADDQDHGFEKLRRGQHVSEDGSPSPSPNPAGCLQPKIAKAQENFDGVYPIDEFKDMLADRKGTLEYNGTRDYALSKRLAVPFCPLPLPEGSLAELQSEAETTYVEEALRGTDSNKPIILALAELDIAHNYHLLQVMNFICGFQRLGLENQFVLFTMSNKSAVFLRRLHPWLRVLYHDGLTQMIKSSGQRLNIPGNRVAKLVLSKMLVNMQREVILSDLDIHWIQDPIEYFQMLRTPAGTLVEMAAMKDSCWLELNSGFIYYRPTDRTKHLLRMALSTKKFVIEHPDIPGMNVGLRADNDQYLLNCALARSAIGGLNYVILPGSRFQFGNLNLACRGEVRQNTLLTAPMIWHTLGFTGKYETEMDQFAALGFVDVDANTGQCIAGRRGTAEDIRNADSAVSRHCSTTSDGIVSAGCQGMCAVGVEPMRAREWLTNFSKMPLK